MHAVTTDSLSEHHLFPYPLCGSVSGTLIIKDYGKDNNKGKLMELDVLSSPLEEK